MQKWLLCIMILCLGFFLPTVDAGKKCDHKCCQKASEAGKVCKKCHKSEDKK